MDGSLVTKGPQMHGRKEEAKLSWHVGWEEMRPTMVQPPLCVSRHSVIQSHEERRGINRSIISASNDQRKKAGIKVA